MEFITQKLASPEYANAEWAQKILALARKLEYDLYRQTSSNTTSSALLKEHILLRTFEQHLENPDSIASVTSVGSLFLRQNLDSTRREELERRVEAIRVRVEAERGREAPLREALRRAGAH